MITTRKLFTEGINNDDSLRLLGEKEYLNLINGRIGYSNKNFRIENVKGTTLISNTLPSGTNKTIGTAKDEARNRMIYFNHNSNGNHGIYCKVGTTIYTVLLNSQVTGGLNFSLLNRINRNAKVVSDLLIWTDGEIRCINIEAGIKLNHPSYVTTRDAYVSPLSSITLIKKPPIYMLVAAKVSDFGQDNNYIKDHSFKFTYRYIYKDYFISALAAFSQLIPPVADGETNNAVDISLPFSEKIDQDVRAIEICARFGNTGKTFIVKRFDYVTDASAISDHNNETIALKFRFYNDRNYIALDDVTANQSFDNVPLQCKTLEIARNRLFGANLLSGYDTPTKTSLSLSLGTIDTGSTGNYTAEWRYFTLTYTDSFGNSQPYTYYYAYVSTLSPPCYLYNSHQGATPPVNVNGDDADVQYATEMGLAYYVQRNYPPPAGGTWQQTAPPTFGNTGSTTTLYFVPDFSVNNFAKSGSTYQVSIAFYDKYRRKCGIVDVTNKITIPDRTFSQTAFTNAINWTLSNTDAVNEIPNWAYYYQIHVTKNLTTRFFVQDIAKGAAYVKKNVTGSATPYDYSTTAYSNSVYALAFDISNFFSYGLGYNYTEGDLIKIHKSSTDYPPKQVIGQDGNYILVQPFDFGAVSATDEILVEIYTPYKSSDTEPMYETGDVYDVLNPTLNTRTYSQTSGTINGDCYAISKTLNGSTNYVAEAMSPNYTIWQIWDTDIGWVNIVDSIGQQQKETSYAFSDTFIFGTKTNGLNKFQPLNTGDLGSEAGAIYQLKLTNKRQEDGTVMLIISQYDCNSAYLGEVQVVASVKNTFIAKSDGVVGTINSLRNNFGTRHPESVIEYLGDVYWINVDNGVFVQYSSNGLFAVSSFKMKRFFNDFSNLYNTVDVQTLNGFTHITTCVDPYHKEVLCVLPKVDNTVPALPYETPPNYASSINNDFDIRAGKTFAFNIDANKWMNSFEFVPDWMEYVGTTLYGFKDGQIYTMNTGAYNSFFGTTYPMRFCYTINENEIKDMYTLAISGNKAPDYTVVYSDYPYEQITDLVADDFVNKEGKFCAAILKDRLSPNVDGTEDEKLYIGDLIKSATPQIMLEYQGNNEVYIDFVDTSYEISRGMR